MEFDLFGVFVKDKCMQNMITKCNSSCLLYAHHLPTCPALCTTPPTVLVISASTYDCRLGHLEPEALSKLSNASTVVCNKCMHEFCHACQLGHHTCMPFASFSLRAVINFDLIHCDLWTTLVVRVSGYKYYLVILDDYSYYLWTFPLHLKSNIFLLCQISSLMCLHILVTPSS
jgi:hypothetical protein